MDYMRDSFIECAKEFSLDVDDLHEKHKSKESLDGIDKCFFGCVLKKKGMVSCCTGLGYSNFWKRCN